MSARAAIAAAFTACCAVLASCSSGPAPARPATPVVVEAPPSAPAPAPLPPQAPAAQPQPVVPSETAKPEWIELTPKIRANRTARVVEFEAVAVLEVGFLEQLVCLAGTREHESLFVFDGKASDIHAALLLAGFEAGSPGRWREVKAEDGSPRIEGVAPKGTAVAITVLMPDGAERPIDWFVRASPIGAVVDRAPPSRFVFGGSRFERSRRTGSERYAADSSGSLIGLATFGDETIGCAEVIPDQAAVAAPVWEVWSERMPEPGTRVRVRIAAKDAQGGDADAPSAASGQIQIDKIQIDEIQIDKTQKQGSAETEPQAEPFRGQDGG